MNIQITGRHIEITDAIRQFTEEQLLSLSKLNEKILKAHVILEVQHTIHHKCEINIEGKNLHLNAHDETKNMYESITNSVEKIERQLRSHKFDSSDKKHRISTHDFESKLPEPAETPESTGTE